MSGMDRLTDEEKRALESSEAYGAGWDAAFAAMNEIKRRASQAAPAPSDHAISKAWAERMLHLDEGVTPSAGAPAPYDGLREAWIAGRDAAAADVAQFGKLFLGNGDDVTEDVLGDIRSLTPPETLSASPAQEGGK